MKKKYIIFTLIIILYSCQNENPIVNPEYDEIANNRNRVPDSLKYLVDFLIEDFNYLPKNIRYDYDKFVLQSDMEISSNGLKEYYEEFHTKKSDGITQHRASICSRSPISSICIRNRTNPCNRDQVYKIYVTFSNQLPNLWQQAIINAMNQWNGLTNNKITFIRGTNQCNDGKGFRGIRITLYSEQENVIARASLAEGGDPGSLIRINQLSSYYNSNDLAALTRVITHELGHNIGYWHTNENFGCFINGTSSNDPASVMHSELNTSYSGFSSFDIAAHNILYPNAAVPFDEVVFKSNNLLCVPF